MKIVKVNVKIGEIDTLSSTLVQLCKDFANNFTIDEYFKKKIEELEDLSLKINKAIKQNKTFSKLEKLDSERDKILRRYSKAIEGYNAIYTDDRKEAAEYLIGIFKKYRSTIYSESYTSQSSSINSLITDLEDEKAVECINKLDGIREIIDEIKIVQDNFKKESIDYISEKANKGANATSFKKPILQLINKELVKYLEVKILTNPDKYRDLVNKFEIAINTANSSIKSSKK